jgi:membrane associated rhomboid family serine protease
MWSVTTWLIAINVAVFILNGLIAVVYTLPDGRQLPTRPIENWGYFSVATAIFGGQVWRFITFQFLHGGLFHLAFNMIALYFFGPMVEYYLGARRYLLFYLLCGMAGTVGYMLLWAASASTGVELIQSSVVPLVGASAGIYAILIAAARIAPDTIVMIYGIIPMRLRALAWIVLAFAVYIIVRQGPNAGGEAAHLGGAVLGLLLIRNPHWLNFANWRPRRHYGRF